MGHIIKHSLVLISGKLLFLVIPIFCQFLLFRFSPYIASAVRMSSSNVPTAGGPIFCDPPRSGLSQYVIEHVNYLNSRCFVAMHQNGITLMILDSNNITQITCVDS